MIGCGGFGGCKLGLEQRLPLRTDDYFKQMASAHKMMQQQHEQLMAAGAEWDGQDGYTMPEAQK